MIITLLIMIITEIIFYKLLIYLQVRCNSLHITELPRFELMPYIYIDTFHFEYDIYTQATAKIPELY